MEVGSGSSDLLAALHLVFRSRCLLGVPQPSVGRAVGLSGRPAGLESLLLGEPSEGVGNGFSR